MTRRLPPLHPRTLHCACRSPLFLKYQSTFILYGTYCACLPGAVACLEDLCQKKGLQPHLDALEQGSQQRFGLKDLLTVPYQRVLKYPLILKEILKHTTAPAEAAALEAALLVMQDVAKHVNEAKRDVENLGLIAELQRGLKDYTIGQRGAVELVRGSMLLVADVPVTTF